MDANANVDANEPLRPFEPNCDNDDSRPDVDERAREELGWKLQNYDWSDK